MSDRLSDLHKNLIMVKVGITGGIGSGKSTVCDIWQSLGAFIINADDLAKSLMINNELIRQEIIKTFGEDSYHANGSLNRAYLADQAFSKSRVKQLNAIVHPHIPKEVELQMKSAEKRGINVTVYEAALLLQNLRLNNLDYVVLVLADQKRRIQWVSKRDDIQKELVLDRIDKQQNFKELTHLADIIIKNNGTFDELEKTAREVYQQF